LHRAYCRANSASWRPRKTDKLMKPQTGPTKLEANCLSLRQPYMTSAGQVMYVIEP
jgi:hypothetical protein